MGIQTENVLLNKMSEENWIKEFDKTFNIPHWKETGYNLNHIKDFIRTLLSSEKQKTLQSILDELPGKRTLSYLPNSDEERKIMFEKIKGFEEGVNEVRRIIVKHLEKYGR